MIYKASMSNWVPTGFLHSPIDLHKNFIHPKPGVPPVLVTMVYTLNTEAGEDGATDQPTHISMTPALPGAGLGKDVFRSLHCSPRSRF